MTDLSTNPYPSFLGTTEFLDWRHDNVQRFAQAAIGDSHDPLTRAQRLFLAGWYHDLPFTEIITELRQRYGPLVSDAAPTERDTFTGGDCNLNGGAPRGADCSNRRA